MLTKGNQTLSLTGLRFDANLGILQGFMHDVRGAGRAALTAAIDGPMYEPVFTGSAVITDGRVRHFSLPNSLDNINGALRFDSRGLRLDDITPDPVHTDSWVALIDELVDRLFLDDTSTTEI